MGAAPLHARGQESVQQFRLGGSASVLDEECIRLTPDVPFVSGSAWFMEPVDLTRPFRVRLSLVLGRKDQAGADGIVFVLHPTMGTGRRGEGMGFVGLFPSLGVEFDTYQNFHLNDPRTDHLALLENGDVFHSEKASWAALPNLEDSERHPMELTWEPGVGLSIQLDGEPMAAFPAERVQQVFGPQRILHWGMTAATGRLSNDQIVCIEQRFINS